MSLRPSGGSTTVAFALRLRESIVLICKWAAVSLRGVEAIVSLRGACDYTMGTCRKSTIVWG